MRTSSINKAVAVFAVLLGAAEAQSGLCYSGIHEVAADQPFVQPLVSTARH